MPEETQVETPQIEPAAPPAADPGSNIVEPDYGDIIARAEAESDPDKFVPAEPQTPPVEAKPGEAPVTPAAIVPPTEPAAPPAQPVAAVPQVPATEPAPVLVQPEAPVDETQQKADYEKLLGEVDAALLKEYGYDPEVAKNLDELGSRPSEYLPALAARIHRQVFTGVIEAVYQMLPNLVPQMVSTSMEQKQAESAAEDAFFRRWPDLKGKDDLVKKAIQAHLAIEPKADQATLIEKAGLLAMIHAGLNPVGAPQAPPTSPPTPHRPAMPGSGGPVPVGNGADVTYEQGIYKEMVEEHLKPVT